MFILYLIFGWMLGLLTAAICMSIQDGTIAEWGRTIRSYLPWE